MPSENIFKRKKIVEEDEDDEKEKEKDRMRQAAAASGNDDEKPATEVAAEKQKLTRGVTVKAEKDRLAM